MTTPSPGGPDDPPDDAADSAPTSGETPGSAGADGPPHRSRLQVFQSGLRSAALTSVEILAVAAGLWVLFWVLGKVWVFVLPALFAIVICTVLWPGVRWLRNRGAPPALAALTLVVISLGILAGVISLIVPSIVDQAPELGSKATDGVRRLQKWVQGPPLNVHESQLNDIVNTITSKVQESSASIASGVFSGVGTATSAVVTLFTTLILVFFFLKDGPRFLPWLNRTLGDPAGPHASAVLTRMWAGLGGFIRTQAIVSAVDAILIGAGLLILQVPLAGALIVITFLGGFIPIVGAFVAGALAVLIALVSNGLAKALIVLIIILVVQQIEGNVLQPVLQSRSMDLHAVIVLGSVTLGGSLFGITGAFLAVPAASALAVLLRYINEQIALRAGETLPPAGEPGGGAGGGGPGGGDPGGTPSGADGDDGHGGTDVGREAIAGIAGRLRRLLPSGRGSRSAKPATET